MRRRRRRLCFPRAPLILKVKVRVRVKVNRKARLSKHNPNPNLNNTPKAHIHTPNLLLLLSAQDPHGAATNASSQAQVPSPISHSPIAATRSTRLKIRVRSLRLQDKGQRR